MWPSDLPVQQVRIARQTDKLPSIEKFYTQGLGLRKIGEFVNHEGFDGIMIGLPDIQYHLEFISHKDGSPGNAPSKENLLVLYFKNMNVVRSISEKLSKMGYSEVRPMNPYWLDISKTFDDPDGWRVTLVGNPGFIKS